jgi:hypothetical protein
MDFMQFIEKYHLMKDGYCSIMDITSFMVIMQYLYLTNTKEQMLKIAADYYDHADEIYNSAQAFKEFLIDKVSKP